MKDLIIDYTNYRGERSRRCITPRRISFEATQYHPEPQWILWAWDQGKGAERGFAMRDIHSFNPPFCAVMVDGT